MDEILVDRAENGVVTVTLNRPHVKNAVAGHMWEEMRRIFAEVTNTESDRVLVITGAGGAFCAGAELSDDMATGTHPLNAMQAVSSAAIAMTSSRVLVNRSSEPRSSPRRERLDNCSGPSSDSK